MVDVDPLTSEEQAVWRPLTRIITVLPRALDDQFVNDTGVSMTDYTVLVSLSEAPGGWLRLTDLAKVTALSLSRISRVVDGLVKRGLVGKSRCPSDRRAANATLTELGHRKLVAAYPGHLARVRAYLFDHLTPGEVAAAGPILARLAAALEPPEPNGAERMAPVPPEPTEESTKASTKAES
ncbi:MarR family winged helix-turn-helix transcriptional regulator [Amycolatopsis saalfeldensis]|uniref:DNA-binding transcriptional regulator, MarR family n=1 Tax=Amycolatopsis saalfeldensis TaxID=394193 RepID=A0A1H8Y641_9PSEU|nr:MarR family transcriptional regulator [Amycolatopsis saalfeldensis]SEP47463.1 DNA-binding transcriptional regulator, MarR family [Amycolatopsis saalfeldensis]